MTDVDEKQSAPEYLNKKVLQNSLRKGLESPSIEITQMKITPGSNAGDNFCTIIHRAIIAYKESVCNTSQNISLIVKDYAIEALRPHIEKLGLISKEIIMYQEMLPKIQGLMSPAVIAPKLYDVIDEPHCNLVFQDMKALGYDMADREVGLDEEHLAIVLEKTAMFHAASMILLQKEPGITRKYLNGMMHEVSVKDELLKTIFESNLRKGAELANQTPGYEHFSPKLTKAADHFEEFALEAVRAKPEKDIQVLLHGDLWVNNFLFLNENGTRKPVDIVFLDFQVSFFGSLGIDLNYLFATSTTVELLKRRMELVECYYYPSFAKSLRTHGFEQIPTLDEVIAQVKDREVFFILALFGILPIVSIDREESKGFEVSQFLDENISDTKRTSGMSSKRFIETFKYSLKDLEAAIDEATKNY